MYFIQHWKAVFSAIIIVAIPFIIWDVIFTSIGVWGFNPLYHLDMSLFGLPFEEILFFICIPYASIFTHYAFVHYFKKVALPSKVVNTISISLFVFIGIVTIFTYPKLYSTINFTIFLILMLYSLYVKDKNLSRFYITFLLILLPFFVVNGVLTGSFIQGEVVWYDNDENLGIRIGSIPIEDIIYAFNLLYLNLILVEKLKPIFTSKKVKLLD